jgi:hypothetical protein
MFPRAWYFPNVWKVAPVEIHTAAGLNNEVAALHVYACIATDISKTQAGDYPGFGWTRIIRAAAVPS